MSADVDNCTIITHQEGAMIIIKHYLGSVAIDIRADSNDCLFHLSPEGVDNLIKELQKHQAAALAHIAKASTSKKG
jgi:hypothetical protein